MWTASYDLGQLSKSASPFVSRKIERESLANYAHTLITVFDLLNFSRHVTCRDDVFLVITTSHDQWID